MIPDWTQLGYSAQARPLGRHKGPGLGAYEPDPHSFIVP